MTDLSSLIARLEEAEGPDRELDRLIHFHVESPWLAEKCVKWVPAAFEGPNDFLWWSAERQAEGKEGYHDGWESYTASVDAAAELLQNKLPGWFWRCGSTPLFPNGWAHVSRYHADHCDRQDEASCADGKAANVAIALVLATLRALQQKGSSNE